MRHEYPYTDMHELNLDWFLEKFKIMQKDFAKMSKMLESLINMEDPEHKFYVTPEMFGAVGDGNADDSLAIQNAIDSLMPVMFSNGKTYKATGLIVPAGSYINGNGAHISGVGSGSVMTVKTYETSQVHTSDPAYLCNIYFEHGDSLLVIDKGLKVTAENITFKDFNIGCDFRSGYEIFLNNFRFEGDPTNITSVGLRVGVDGGADSIFKNFTGRDVAIATEVCSGNNIFEDFHFWILTQSLFEHSVFFKENAGTDNVNKYIRPYFDCYRSLLQQNKWSASYIDAPTIKGNSSVVTGESILLDIQNESFTDSYVETRIKIVNAKFKTDSDSLCTICDNHSAPIDMTFYPTSAQQYAKIAECNIKSLGTVDSALSATSVNPVQNRVIKSALDGKASTAVATTTTSGLMSATDKTNLDTLMSDYQSASTALG